MLVTAVALSTPAARPGVPYVVDGATPYDVATVVAALRGSDRFEVEAVGFDAERDIPLMVHAARDTFTAYLGDEPVFIFGTVEIMPGVRQLIGFGTEKTRRVIPSVTWFTYTHWLPDMFENGVRRIQVHIPKEAARSLRWLLSFGMYVECEMKDYAANGATMLQLAYTRNEFIKHVSIQKEVGASADDHAAAREN